MVIVSENIGGFFCVLVIKYFSGDLSYVSPFLRQDSLRAHNEYRSKHGVPALKLSDKINAVAQVRFPFIVLYYPQITK